MDYLVCPSPIKAPEDKLESKLRRKSKKAKGKSQKRKAKPSKEDQGPKKKRAQSSYMLFANAKRAGVQLIDD